MLGDELVKATNFKPLVSEELFDLANGIVTSKKYAYKHERINDKYPLKRHVFCSECREPLTAYIKKERLVYYKCNTSGCRKNYSGETLHYQYSNLLRSYGIPNEFKPVLSCMMKDLFNDWNKIAINQQKQFKTRITEIENKVQTAKVKYGCGEIEKDIYDAVRNEFEPQLNDLKQKLEIAEINLSNYEPYVDYALQMSCKLGGLWNYFDIVKKEKLQNLVFPEGVFYDQKIEGYRTPKHNSFLHLINTEIASYKNKKSDKKKKSSICRSQCG